MNGKSGTWLAEVVEISQPISDGIGKPQGLERICRVPNSYVTMILDV